MENPRRLGNLFVRIVPAIRTCGATIPGQGSLHAAVENQLREPKAQNKVRIDSPVLIESAYLTPMLESASRWVRSAQTNDGTSSG
jgi:hypothetical protein